MGLREGKTCTRSPEPKVFITLLYFLENFSQTCEPHALRIWTEGGL